ncbi:MAG: hypothetical protein R3A79_24415 [Nannocystaceae bacterium]
MTTLALAALLCCIIPALSVAVGGVVDVARSRALGREVTRAFANVPRRPK